MDLYSSKIILIIDDDEDDMLFLQEAIEKINDDLTFMTAGDGAHALHLLNNSEALPSLIFLDINMPVMGGMEFLAQMKKCDGLKNIPVAIYTTARSPESEKLAFTLGAEHYIQKPVSLSGIIESIRPVLIFLNGTDKE